jgi:hypothetical protein
MTRLALAVIFVSLAAAQTPTAVTLTSSANPSAFGQRVTLSADVSPSSADGSVTFYDGMTVLGIRPVVSGHAVSRDPRMEPLHPARLFSVQPVL